MAKTWRREIQNPQISSQIQSFSRAIIFSYCLRDLARHFKTYLTETCTVGLIGQKALNKVVSYTDSTLTLPDATRRYQTLPDTTSCYQTLPDANRRY
jgi:hypothetical protein